MKKRHTPGWFDDLQVANQSSQRSSLTPGGTIIPSIQPAPLKSHTFEKKRLLLIHWCTLHVDIFIRKLTFESWGLSAVLYSTLIPAKSSSRLAKRGSMICFKDSSGARRETSPQRIASSPVLFKRVLLTNPATLFRAWSLKSFGSRAKTRHTSGLQRNIMISKAWSLKA